MLKIDHIAIYAKNILCLSEFYIQTFGFVEKNRKYHEDGKIKMIGLKDVYKRQPLSIDRILSNPAYLGHMHLRKTETRMYQGMKRRKRCV